MVQLLLFGILSIVVSFLCSILESVLLSVTPTFVDLKKKEQHKWALTLESFKNNIDTPLIAILTLNTVAHTVGAIGVGASAEAAFGTGDNVVGIVSAVMTALILIVSEIIPKTIGATYWKPLAGPATRILQLFIFPLKWTGVIWFLRLTTRLIGKDAHVSVMSRADFSAMTEMADRHGVFDKNESTVIHNLLRFSEILTKDIMTPRSVMKVANAEQKVVDFHEQNPALRFSRVPIYKNDLENIIGIVLKDEVLETIVNDGGDRPLASIKRDIMVTTRDTPLPELFEKLVGERTHIALVVDSYGSVSGLVTMEDIIETLLGLEIMDESDDVADLQLLARRNWEARAKRMGLAVASESAASTTSTHETEGQQPEPSA
ncbi:MAG: hemolysin [unclassified Hahellaceae]|nr:hemolysin [Hahellaceae bacterium]|tara:strand:- start:28903 stop:30027 length:1125 start_codon:yes stop_codon:yes gene_type:complete